MCSVHKLHFSPSIKYCTWFQLTLCHFRNPIDSCEVSEIRQLGLTCLVTYISTISSPIFLLVIAFDFGLISIFQWMKWYSTNIKEPIEIVIVTTILTIRIGCPKTVNLFNKKHISTWEEQAALRLTSWTCILVTVYDCDWTGHIPDTKQTTFVCMYVQNRDLLLTQGPWCHATRSHVVSLVSWWSSVFSATSLLSITNLLTHTLSLSLSFCLSLIKQGDDIQGLLLIFLLLKRQTWYWVLLPCQIQ